MKYQHIHSETPEARTILHFTFIHYFNKYLLYARTILGPRGKMLNKTYIGPALMELRPNGRKKIKSWYLNK